MQVNASYSPDVLERMVYAGVQASSFREASTHLQKLAGLKIDRKQIERWTRRIGGARIAERDRQVEQWANLPLPMMTSGSPPGKAPNTVMVSMDGGRLQILDQDQEAKADGTSETLVQEASRDEADEITTEPLCEEDRENKSSYWRESKIGCLVTFQSQTYEADPCPEIPENFLEPPRILKLSREICRNAPQDSLPSDAANLRTDREEAELVAGRPEMLVKTVVATKAPYVTFGPLLAAAAWARGFSAAKRKAFVADGAKINWTIWRRHFSHYTPILDFIHVISRVFAAAMAGRDFKEGWPAYVRWANWLWSGRVAELLVEVERRRNELGPPEKTDSATSPRRVVSDALTYLTNNQAYLDYARYRQEGLPITSSLMESTVKQVSRRVKGTEKFWSSEGAEPILQLRGDYISDTDPLLKFWEPWQRQASGQRSYSHAA